MVVNDNIIGIRIKLLREERGLTLDQVAHDLRRLYGTKVNKGMISKWESGTYNFTISTLIGICEKMDLNFDPQIYDKVLTPQNTEFVSKKRKNLDAKKWVDWTPGDRVNLEKGVA